MTKLDEMWAALAAYQPQADAAGHGETWARMCSEKKYVVARDAAYSAYAVAAYSAYAAADAAAVAWAQKAIDKIKKITIPAQPAQKPAHVQWNPKDHYNDGWRDAMNSIAAQPAQEPVTHQYQSWNGIWRDFISKTHYEDSLKDGTWPIRALYTTPPRRTWVGLTPEEINYQAKKSDHEVFFALGAFWAEVKLKDKNI